VPIGLDSGSLLGSLHDISSHNCCSDIIILLYYAGYFLPQITDAGYLLIPGTSKTALVKASPV